MTSDWEAPRSARRIPAWIWPLCGALVIALAVQIARAPEEPALPGLPVEVVEEPAPATDPTPTPARRTVPDPSDRWIPVPTAPVPLGGDLPSTWTGRELIVWNGEETVGWTPGEDLWRRLEPRADGFLLAGWTATWTGNDILYVGVAYERGVLVTRMLGYSPATDAWSERAAPPLAARVEQSVAWDGERLHVWGGGRPAFAEDPFDDGASYDPSTDTWTVMPPGPLLGRVGPSLAWLSEVGELVVWGGTDDGVRQLVDGAAYRPEEGTWRRLPDAPWTSTLPPATTADGRHLYAWGLPEAGLHLPDGMVYDAVTDTWEPLPDLLAQERAGASATLTDDGLLVVWGGLDRRLEQPRRDGFVVDLAAERWRQIPPAPVGHQGATVTWLSTPDSQGLLVWGPEAGGALYPGRPLDEQHAGPRPASR